MKKEKVKRTGKFATKLEVKKIIKEYQKAQNTPCIALTSASALGGRDFASLAWQNFYDFLSKIARKHGLPKITGQYGLDTKTGEFLT